MADDIDYGQRSEREKRQSFFKEWKQRKGSNATYKALVSALLKINHRDDAEYLCRLLQGTSTATASTSTTTSTTISAPVVCASVTSNPGDTTTTGNFCPSSPC